MNIDDYPLAKALMKTGKLWFRLPEVSWNVTVEKSSKKRRKKNTKPIKFGKHNVGQIKATGSHS